MAGYDIHNDSMDGVADIISSTISRSNVNIVGWRSHTRWLPVTCVWRAWTSRKAVPPSVFWAIWVEGNAGGNLVACSFHTFCQTYQGGTGKFWTRLGIRFTEMRDIEGGAGRETPSYSGHFRELNKKGASMADVQAIFGKIGGNAAMMFLKNYDKLRELTSYNRGPRAFPQNWHW
ncbi:hypothetical protein NXW09_29605 [Bacteroides ovatus]|nr:hypothetical protein [Bacteroides ovatus]